MRSSSSRHRLSQSSSSRSSLNFGRFRRLAEEPPGCSALAVASGAALCSFGRGVFMYQRFALPRLPSWKPILASFSSFLSFSCFALVASASFLAARASSSEKRENLSTASSLRFLRRPLPRLSFASHSSSSPSRLALCLRLSVWRCRPETGCACGSAGATSDPWPRSNRSGFPSAAAAVWPLSRRRRSARDCCACCSSFAASSSACRRSSRRTRSTLSLLHTFQVLCGRMISRPLMSTSCSLQDGGEAL
mmetsp:Transcript_11258/g.42017  ORF Transcript_11258/g.42017 Transcript_11258/m.42017 type:complete len:249 (+) Transcript_11258:1240-1986(+)